MNAPSLTSTVLAVDPRDDVHWRDLAAARGSLFTSPPWIAAVCDSYGFTPQARVVLDADGNATDGFAWVEIDDIRGNRLISLPFSDRAEPMVSDVSAWPSLVENALSRNIPLSIRCLEGAAPTGGPRFERVGEAAWSGTRIDVPLEDLHHALHPSARRNIEKARRRGVEVRAVRGIEAIRTFHGLHRQLRKNKFRLLAQSAEFFERIWEEFSGADGIVTLLAYAAGEPIASAVLLAWEDTLYFKFSASRAEALSLRPNFLIYFHTIQWAAENGFRLVDWGLSDLEPPGLIDFKRQWANEESRIVSLRKVGHNPSHPSEAGSLIGELTNLLTDGSVPDEITDRAGTLLYRYFT